MHLLVAEDDRRLARILERGLASEGHAVDLVHDGEEALIAGASGDYDVLVIDVMMPAVDGFEVVRRLRDRRIGTPILLLTARGEIEDRVEGLDTGADDYLTKPFAFDELSARIRALSRRPPGGDPLLRAGGLEMDVARHEVRADGVPVSLTPTEYRLLEQLLRHAGTALTRRALLDRVWSDGEPEPNAVDLYVHYLRRKLKHAIRISTVRGVGYRLEREV